MGPLGVTTTQGLQRFIPRFGLGRCCSSVASDAGSAALDSRPMAAERERTHPDIIEVAVEDTDAMLLLGEATFPGRHARARPQAQGVGARRWCGRQAASALLLADRPRRGWERAYG